MKAKCVKFRTGCEFVRACAGVKAFSFLSSPTVSTATSLEEGRVSGRQKYRYIVSTIAVANGFAATVLMLARHAPSAARP